MAIFTCDSLGTSGLLPGLLDLCCPGNMTLHTHTHSSSHGHHEYV